MSFLDFIDPRKKGYNELVAIINHAKGSVSGKLKTSSKQQLSEYRAWVYACVSLISDRVSTVPHSFYNRLTGEEITSKNKGYRIFTKPFVSPNPLMSFRFIKAFCQLQLDLCGMACIYKARNGLGQVWELWPINMNNFSGMKISTDSPMNPTITYEFIFDNKTYAFDKSELIVLYYPNPENVFFGMSPIQAQAYAIDIEKYIEIYERDFFKNSARIDMALVTDQALNEEKAAFIKDRWKSKFNGRFHDIAVLDSGLKAVPLNFTNKDFEFLHLAGWSKEKVQGAYRVPAYKLGSSDSNRSGAVQSDISFNRDSIQPRLTLWDEELTREVLSSFDERIEVWHDNPIPRDRELEVKEARTYLGGLPMYTINDYKKKMGEKPITGGDVMLVPSGWQKLEDVGKNIDGGSSDGNNDTDPNRHDDDEPHLNPDGTDDRDDSPTDSRDFSGVELEEKLRSFWKSKIQEFVAKNCGEENKEENFKCFIKDLMHKTVKVISDFDKIDLNDWIEGYSNKVTDEILNTICLGMDTNKGVFDWKGFVENQFKSNPRVSKIINSSLRGCINYAKYLTFTNIDGKIKWVIRSNECAHEGRLKNIISDNGIFELGGKKVRFPGESLNFSCDCTITLEKE